jgi:hypothetical protein
MKRRPSRSIAEQLSRLIREQRRDRSKVEAISLGGEVRRLRSESAVLSLAMAGEQPEPSCEPTGLHLVDDWERTFEAAGFDADEKLFALEHYVRGTPWRAAGAMLGWSIQKVECVRRGVRRLLARGASESISPMLETYESSHAGYWEALPSGRRVYVLIPHGSVFREILASERPKIIFENCPQRAISAGKSMSTISQLNEKRGVEAVKLDRLRDRAEAAKVILRAAKRDLDRIEYSFKLEHEEALLAEKPWLSTAAEKAIKDASSKINNAMLALSASEGALAKQAAILDGLDGEIQARRLEAFREDIGPAKQELKEALRNLVRTACRVDQIGHRHGCNAHTLASELFPNDDPKDPLTGFVRRSLEAGLVNNAIGLQIYLIRNYNKPYIEVA